MSDKRLFLGKAVDPTTGKPAAESFLVDPDDLTTHGLVVGMTGSGKTALGIVLIEELLKAGVPVLAIDPKGDLGNLLLTFPSLTAAELAPWIETGGLPAAESEARRWADGLAQSGLCAADVARLAASREAVIYTPGSSAGVPLDLLGSLAPPSKDADEEDRRDVVVAFLTGLLGLVGIEADPVRSREFILLARCVEAIWERGETATLEALLKTAASPPMTSVGALPLETFYPAKERQELVLALNNLLASPTTAAFRTGAALDVGAMLGPGNGSKTRLSIVSIAHLSDAERLFVVATLLSRVMAWMRGQSGSSSLRAAIFVDEIFGFFPPSAEPPTKRPLLTLLKQARAFGVGVVLATQNPVDLDYKGLANCGCWWVGTLQTERDRKRLEDGLAEASGSGEAASFLSATKKRVFLLHDVHRGSPALVETRWAMSYLRGPMTREEIARAKALGGSAGVVAATPSGPDTAAAPASAAEGAPPVPPEWPVRWLQKRGAEIASPHLYVKYAVRYRLEGAVGPETTALKLFRLESASPTEVLESDPLDLAADALADAEPAGKVRYAPLPAWLGPGAVKSVEKSVRERLPDKLAATLLRDPVTKALSGPGETPETFAERVESSTMAPAALREKLEKKRQALEAAQAQEKSREMETYASVAGAALDLIGGFLGKRKSVRVGKVGAVLSKRRMEGAAESKVEALRAEVADLEAKVAPPDPARFEKVQVVPLKAHVDILGIGVAWLL